MIECFLNKGDSSLFVCGAFLKVNSTYVNGIFEIKNTNWFTLGNGISQFAGSPKCLKSFSEKLFMGGGFLEVENASNTAYLASWNDTNWSGPAGGAAGNDVYDFIVFENKLFVGGEFNSIGGVAGREILAFDGENWLNVGDMDCNWVRALETFNGELFAGGNFGLRKYLGGTDWLDFPGGPDAWVYDMTVDTFNNFLYVGGDFGYIDGGVPSYMAAMWDGFKWNSLGTNLPTAVWFKSMAVYRGDLYIGSGMTNLNDGLEVNCIAFWNGEKWDSVGSGTNNTVAALEVFQDTLYVGGYFNQAGDLPAFGLAKVFVPDTSCSYIKPRVFTVADTFDLIEGQVEVQFYNNNAYVDSWDWYFGSLGTADIKDPAFIFTDTGDFNIQVTVAHSSCVKTASKTIHIRNGVGMEEIESLNFKVYPNPSDNNFTVQLNFSEYKNCQLRITGINGHTKTIIPVESEMTLVKTDGWVIGTYICNLFVDGKLVKSEKLILK